MKISIIKNILLRLIQISRIMRNPVLKNVKVCIIIFSGILCFSYFLQKKKNARITTELVFSNIEALASGEDQGVACFGAGSLSCNGGYYKYKMFR